MTIRICDYAEEQHWEEVHSMENHRKLWVHLGFDTKVCVEGVNKEFLEAITKAQCFSLLEGAERREYQREIDRLKKQYKEVCKDVDILSEIIDKVIEVVRDEIDE